MTAWELRDRCPSCSTYLYGYENCPQCNMPAELIREHKQIVAKDLEERSRRFEEGQRYAAEWRRRQKPKEIAGSIFIWALTIGILVVIIGIGIECATNKPISEVLEDLIK